MKKLKFKLISSLLFILVTTGSALAMEERTKNEEFIKADNLIDKFNIGTNFERDYNRINNKREKILHEYDNFLKKLNRINIDENFNINIVSSLRFDIGKIEKHYKKLYESHVPKEIIENEEHYKMINDWHNNNIILEREERNLGITRKELKSIKTKLYYIRNIKKEVLNKIMDELYEYKRELHSKGMKRDYGISPSDLWKQGNYQSV